MKIRSWKTVFFSLYTNCNTNLTSFTVDHLPSRARSCLLMRGWRTRIFCWSAWCCHLVWNIWTYTKKLHRIFERKEHPECLKFRHKIAIFQESGENILRNERINVSNSKDSRLRKQCTDKTTKDFSINCVKRKQLDDFYLQQTKSKRIRKTYVLIRTLLRLLLEISLLWHHKSHCWSD